MPDRASRPPRSVAAIEAELADVERFLRETPPHSGSGVRSQLEARQVALRRELAAARRQA